MPVVQSLKNENIQVIPKEDTEYAARKLKIAVLNIMPTKEAAELQFLRLLSNTPLDTEVTFVQLSTHKYKCCSEEYLQKYYKPFHELKSKKFDGFIITGAPVERLEFEEVDYWRELEEILDWTKTNVRSTLHVCWSAQAGLYHHYNIKKYHLDEKLSGLYIHRPTDCKAKITRGFDDEFFVPHSRYTGIHKEDIEQVPELKILAESGEAGVYLLEAEKYRQVFLTGHPEYDTQTLANEYERDVKKELSPKIPQNYFPQDDPKQAPISKWRDNANLLFSNWLNYYVNS